MIAVAWKRDGSCLDESGKQDVKERHESRVLHEIARRVKKKRSED